jgi:hypothetical protein
MHSNDKALCSPYYICDIPALVPDTWGGSLEAFSGGGYEDCEANGQWNKSLGDKTIGVDREVFKSSSVRSTFEENSHRSRRFDHFSSQRWR